MDFFLEERLSISEKTESLFATGESDLLDAKICRTEILRASLLIAIEPKINSWSNDRARAGWTRGGGTSVIPGGLGAQAPRYRGTPCREELTRVPHRTAHTAHQLIQRTSAGSSGDLQISRGPRGRNSGNKRSARLPEKRSGNGRSVGRASHPSITSIVTSG